MNDSVAAQHTQACSWVYDDEDCDKWDTGCDNAFTFLTDGPRENDFVYCPYCGRLIQEEQSDE